MSELTDTEISLVRAVQAITRMIERGQYGPAARAGRSILKLMEERDSDLAATRLVMEIERDHRQERI